MRVVSLLPSATEIVCALGREPTLVGRSEECDYPATVRLLPVVMRARSLDADRPSDEIDRRVQATRRAGESLYELDLDQIRALAPEVLLTQDLCSVCSVTEEEVARACRTAGVAPTVVALRPTRLAEVWESVRTVGDAVGVPATGRDLATRLEGRTTRPSTPGRPRPRVAVVEWLDPPILAGLWTPDIIAAAGGESVGPPPGRPGVRTDWATLATSRPDLLVVSPCSFSVERTLHELESPGMAAQVAAVQPARGTVVADEAYFSRPGPRLADGVDLLARLVKGDPPAGPMPARWWTPQEAAAP
jgi:iron complex transport system substrate-binding protein